MIGELLNSYSYELDVKISQYYLFLLLDLKTEQERVFFDFCGLVTLKLFNVRDFLLDKLLDDNWSIC